MSLLRGPQNPVSPLRSPVVLGPIATSDNTPTYLLPAWLTKQTWTNPAAADDDAFVLAKTTTSLPAAAGTVTFTPDGVVGTTLLAHHRNVSIVVTHATAVVAASGVISGFDRHGAALTEAWSVTAGTGSKTFTGAVSFYKVTSITYVTAADATANTFKAGTGVKFGFDFSYAVGGVMKEIVDAVVVTNGVFVAGSAAANADRRGTYAPNTAPDGVHDYVVYHLVDDPTAL